MQINNWIFKYEGFETISCTVPCSMYSVLLENKKIPDYFLGMNEKEITKYSDKDCEFEADFLVSKCDAAKKYKELIFYGLDTICDIFLNGRKLSKTMNMHRTYVFDVNGYIKEGKNSIHLHFYSPTKYLKRMNEKHRIFTCDGPLPGVSHLRKAYYMSGWDWGPTIPDMGIFRPVEFLAYEHDRIAEINILQEHKNGEVKLKVSAKTVKNAESCELYAKIDGQREKLVEGEAEFIIKNPRLWWVRGYGAQNLYECKLTLISNGEVIDEEVKKIGLRTLTVSTEEKESGSEFCFVINGVKIFAMGANYIPQDNLLPRITPEKTKELLESCIDANFNCIRVWGGGYWPEDEFYNMCDAYGLLVWQDFMSACFNVWLTKDFEEEFMQEAEDNLKRLRHHASLGLLCGNNEVEGSFYNDWILHNKTRRAASELDKVDYLRLYEHLLPALCEKFAPDVFYWPSSPSSGGGFDRPHDETRGDTHYWDIWFSGEPFTDCRKHKSRFCSEYGFESFPSMKTIEYFCPKEHQNPFSPVMEHHQKCSSGNAKILTYLSYDYLYPYNFSDLVYASQLIQADAIRCVVEHFRRIRGYCMGTIYWQLNDCWPGVSWSSIDCFGRYKALHYAAKKFYAPIAMGLFNENDKMIVNISNETREDFYGTLTLCICRNDFKVLKECEKQVVIPALSSLDVAQMDVFDGIDRTNTYFYAKLTNSSEEEIIQRTELFIKPKSYSWQKPEIKVDIKKDGDKTEFFFTSNCLAKGVYVDFEGFDIHLSDNFFDIISAAQVKVAANTKKSVEELLKGIKIKTVYDIGR